MLGIFISIATIFILISLSLGLQNAVEEQFKILGTDKFFILPGTGFLGPPGSVGGVILTEDDIDVISKVSGVKDYSYATIANSKVEYDRETKYFIAVGIPLDKTPNEPKKIITEFTSLVNGEDKKLLERRSFAFYPALKKITQAGVSEDEVVALKTSWVMFCAFTRIREAHASCCSDVQRRPGDVRYSHPNKISARVKCISAPREIKLPAAGCIKSATAVATARNIDDATGDSGTVVDESVADVQSTAAHVQTGAAVDRHRASQR